MHLVRSGRCCCLPLGINILMPSLDPARLSNPSSNDEVLDAFLGYLVESGIEPYEHQETAILELYAGNNVILNTPTGSGKSLVALAVQFRAVCQERRCFYTVPVKALANEKFLSLCQTFGPEKVGMITGDATVNPEAPVICCTAEILSNLALREGSAVAVNDIIMDEFHFYSDQERGVAWQVPLLTMPQAKFLLMSATLGDTSFFEESLTRLTNAPTRLVQSSHRPVPLEYEYSTTALEEKIEALVESGRAPVYLVHFTQLSCARTAQDLMSRNFCSKAEKEQIAKELIGADFRSPYGKEIKKLIRHGLGIHHAGLLPKYRVLVERLAQKGLLKVICGTDTLGVGVNVPIRTVLFTQLFKFGGEKTKTLTARDFHQISGRAGRRGYDNVGYVVAQAPEHVIANLKAEEKAGEKGKKNRLVKQKPPEKGFVMWDEKTFRTLIEASPEKLRSSFTVSHGMLLHVLGRRNEDGCVALRQLIRQSHESESGRLKLRRRAFSLFRGLVEGRILTIIPPSNRTGPVKVELNISLQEDFSLNQALGLYLVEAVAKLDMTEPAYPLQVLSLVEAILENPTVILNKQVDKLKTQLMADLKSQGVEYDERIERLEAIEHPKPGKDFIYATYNDFVLRHPWAKETSVRPKSIFREMFENWQSFEDYVKVYGLERSEAVLLRHLSDTYKTLVQTVPDSLKTPELDEAESFLGSMLRNIDSSLLDEWEKMSRGDNVHDSEKPRAEDKPMPISRSGPTFARLIRGAVFDVLKLLAQRDFENAWNRLVSKSDSPSLDELVALFSLFSDTHGLLRFDPEARNSKHFRLSESPRSQVLVVEQVMVDTGDSNDWSVRFEVDLVATDERGELVMSWEGMGPV